MGKIIDAVKDTCWHYVLYAVIKLKSYCSEHPTCDDCPFKEKHTGCLFRGRSPREW